jgi:hypothetical protein
VLFLAALNCSAQADGLDHQMAEMLRSRDTKISSMHAGFRPSDDSPTAALEDHFSCGYNRSTPEFRSTPDQMLWLFVGNEENGNGMAMAPGKVSVSRHRRRVVSAACLLTF